MSYYLAGGTNFHLPFFIQKSLVIHHQYKSIEEGDKRMSNQLNIEIKARCKNHEKIRKILKSKKAVFKGLDKQTDIYFNSETGRFKLRKGNIENSLVFYDREDIEGPKQSNVILHYPQKESNIEEILVAACGIKIKVVKDREIYLIDNIKFHLDKIKGLGTFVEIEAIDAEGNLGEELLYKQCNEYLNLFEISKDDLLSKSYSDMLINNMEN